MAQTRSELVAARVFDASEDGSELGTVSINCMFNPYEYSVSKSNTFEEKPGNGSDVPQVEFKKAGAQTLKLQLFFDTYQTGEDVSLTTNKLWRLMEAKTNEQAAEDTKQSPPFVVFLWGVFRFVSVITSMTQKFTLFKMDGTPVRATADITFTQYSDLNDYPNQNPTSGGGPIQRVRQVTAGDRLDTIAADIYGDSSKWRLIAEYNNINDPLALKPGTYLGIPQS